MRGEIEPRIKSRDCIFILGRTYDKECARYMRVYIEKSIIGPHKFLSDEFIPYIPFEPETSTESKKTKKNKKKKKSKAASSPTQ